MTSDQDILTGLRFRATKKDAIKIVKGAFKGLSSEVEDGEDVVNIRFSTRDYFEVFEVTLGPSQRVGGEPIPGSWHVVDAALLFSAYDLNLDLGEDEEESVGHCSSCDQPVESEEAVYEDDLYCRGCYESEEL